MIKIKPRRPLTFHYVGINKNGQKTKGLIEAKNLTLARVHLRKQGILINKVTQKSRFIFYKINKKITASDITLFSRQLATLVESDISLIQSLTILSKGELNQNLKHLIEDIKKRIETGSTFAEALKKYPTYFNELFCNLIAAGEHSGSLDIMLNKISNYKEKSESIKKKIKKALTYPIAVILVAFLVTISLLLFVIPQFESLFRDFGAELPVLTKALIQLSRLCQSYGYLIFGLLGLSLYLVHYLIKRIPSFKNHFDRILLILPFIGPLIKKAAIARFSRTLAITFTSGLSLVEALQSVAGTTGNSVFAKATESIKNEISTGQQINKALQNTHLFPNMVIQMVAIGEDSGNLEKMLSKIADFYEEEVDNLVNSFNRLLEPVIISFLGILVGGLIIALYLPIFKLGSVI
jgi:type IV pilus assembly protein PilC